MRLSCVTRHVHLQWAGRLSVISARANAMHVVPASSRLSMLVGSPRPVLDDFGQGHLLFEGAQALCCCAAVFEKLSCLFE